MRPKRESHIFCNGSLFVMVPVARAAASFTLDGLGFDNVSDIVSEPSSTASSSTGTETVLLVSSGPKLSVPEVNV